MTQDNLPPLNMPVDAVNPDQLPQSTPPKWDELCRIVGDLYLNSCLRVNALESQTGDILERSREEFAVVARENEDLRREIELLNQQLEALKDGN